MRKEFKNLLSKGKLDQFCAKGYFNNILHTGMNFSGEIFLH